MTWLIWRQVRTQVLAVYALVAVCATVLALTGPRLADLTPVDGSIFGQLTESDRFIYFSGIVVIAVVPALIGIFWGAPLVARELENGTHRLAWNQSVTRTHWLAAKLGIAALATAAAVGALSLAITWWADPLDGIQSETRGSLPSRLAPVAFAMRGIVPIGYAVFALVLGVTLGVLLRRSLPAMALTLAVYVAAQVAVPFLVRPHLIPPVTQMSEISTETMRGIGSHGDGDVIEFEARADDPSDWVIDNDTINSAGEVVALPAWFGACMPGPPRAPSAGAPDTQVDAPPPGLARQLLRSADVRGLRAATRGAAGLPLLASPVGRDGLVRAAAALLAALSFWWTRRKLS